MSSTLNNMYTQQKSPQHRSNDCLVEIFIPVRVPELPSGEGYNDTCKNKYYALEWNDDGPFSWEIWDPSRRSAATSHSRSLAGVGRSHAKHNGPNIRSRTAN